MKIETVNVTPAMAREWLKLSMDHHCRPCPVCGVCTICDPHLHIGKNRKRQ